MFCRAYAREAAATLQLAVTSEPLLALSTNDPVLPIAVPVHDERSPDRVGLAVIGLKTSRLVNVLADVPLPPGSYLTLVDLHEGRVLVDSTIVNEAPQAFMPAEQLTRIRAGEETFRSADRDGATFFHAWSVLDRGPLWFTCRWRHSSIRSTWWPAR